MERPRVEETNSLIIFCVLHALYNLSHLVFVTINEVNITMFTLQTRMSKL